MSKFASFLGGNVVVAGGAAAAAVVAVIVVATVVFKSPDPQPDTATVTPDVVAPADPAQPATNDKSKAETAAVAEPETTASQATPEPASAPTGIAPVFDLVRVEPDGRTLVAGQAAPNVDINIILDRQEVAVVATDSAGKFVSFLDIAASDKPRVMSLAQAGEGGLASESTVIIAASPTVTASVAEAADETASQSGAESATGATGEANTDAQIPADTTTSETAPVTTTVLLKDASGVTVMQAPTEASPEVMSTVALDTISYSESGEVQLAGRSGQQGFVRVYLNNSPVITSQIEEDGKWRMELPDVDTGVYTLRVDEVKQDGTVVSRVETPFKREDQETLQAATDLAESAAEVVTVQPGSTLWAIADERYGDGVMYVRVFDANRDRIRDPDLIYPGQIFNLPEN